MEKIDIRTIHDISGNIYDIFDFMVKDRFDRWISKCTYFELDEAVKCHPNTPIVDSREK